MPRATKAAPVLRESDIQKTCCEFLRLDGWVVLRMEPVSDTSTVRAILAALNREVALHVVFDRIAEIVKKCLRGRGANELGMPDVLAIRYWNGKYLDPQTADVLWFEAKRPGGKCTPLQRAWHSRERARGALVWVLGDPGDPDANITPASIEAFRAHYCASGLARKVKA